MAEKRETKQKKAIEEAISKINTFFTAEEIHSKLQNKIGIATVYRFLNDMVKERLIHKFTCERKGLYSKKGMSHSHFVCESCGNKKHISLERIDFLKKFIDEEICHVQIEINGICSDCKSR